MKTLVLGASGQLARHLREELPDATFWGRATLDLARGTEVRAAVKRFAPAVIVNAAAYTAVDRAESERSLAWAINGSAVASLAEAATALGVPMLHVSTDYVFPGDKASEYDVEDAVGPLNVYGLTKLAGELAVRTLCAKSWILRTSWVFSEHGANFVHTILRLAATRHSLRIVNDQFGRPTYAGDIARAIARIVSGSRDGWTVPFGLYHATGGPIVTWYEFAREIVRGARELGLLEMLPSIEPITTAEYPTPARRPANSALRPSPAVTSEIGTIFDWRAGLRRVLRILADRRDG